MAYVKNNWVDREGTTRYFETVDDDGALIFTPDYTQVTELGTPVNADNMNHIEEGIAAGSFTKYDSMATYAKNDLVTTIVDNELKVYKSLQDNNTNTLDNSSLWEEVEFSGGGTGLQMFDTILKDHILTYEESKGLALQGTYVYKEALAGSRYGYPDFYAKCLEEYNETTSTETVNGVEVKVNSNGHKFYDIANKDAIDSFFNTMGSAWFYGVDTENERVFLPRKKLYYGINSTAPVSVYGNGLAIGLTDGTKNYGLEGGNGYLTSTTPRYGYNVGTAFTGTDMGNVVMGLTTDSSKSGITGRADTSTLLKQDSTNYLYICVGNTTNYESMTEVVNQGMEILEQVAQKVNVDGTNLTAEGKRLISSYAMPSSRYIDLTVGASGAEYSAPADGFVFCIRNSTQEFGTIILQNLTTGIGVSHQNILNGNNAYCYLPVRKNDIFQWRSATSGTFLTFRFYYTQGSESEAN